MSGSLLVTGAELDGEVIDLRIEDGRFTEIAAGISPRPGEETLDAARTAIVPGLINGHTHAAMTLFRGYADDLPLMEWLERHIWPAEERLIAEDVYWGTRLACLEMVRAGTVHFWDMYWQPNATARAVVDSGMRATIGAPLIDIMDPSGHKVPRDAEAGLAELEGFDPAFVRPALAPHAIYTVSEGGLEWIAARASETGLPIHIHLSETEVEVEGCLAQHGVRPAALLDRVGALGPNTICAHSVWIDDSERELIAASGATLVTCPHANMKLAVGGIFDLPAARDAGIPIALGTDGAGSNNALDMLGEARQLALIQKHRAGDAASVTAAETLEIAAGMRSGLLGGAGPIAVGNAADFALVRLDTPALAVGELSAGLAYASSPDVVDSTVVGGRVLMRAGEMVGIDEAEVIAKARESAARLGLV